MDYVGHSGLCIQDKIFKVLTTNILFFGSNWVFEIFVSKRGRKEHDSFLQKDNGTFTIYNHALYAIYVILT